jgi:hypothetical protein
MYPNVPFHALTALFGAPAEAFAAAAPGYGRRYGNRLANCRALRDRHQLARARWRAGGAAC